MLRTECFYLFFYKEHVQLDKKNNYEKNILNYTF